MKTLMKWGLIAGVVVVLLIVGAIVLVPRFVDVKQYKPKIEELVSEQTGRSFSMGDEIDISVFPWVGVRLSDIRLGSPKGFTSPDMVKVKGFEVRLKVMPLLSRQVQVKTFVVDSPEIYLEKNKAGTGNWEGLGTAGRDKSAEKKTEESGEDRNASGELPIKSLMVDRFSIINGLVVYSDPGAGLTKKLTDFNLDLTEISLDKPFLMELSAKLDEKLFALKTKLQASPSAISLSDGTFTLDDSTLSFAAGIKEFEKPNISFDLNLDQIDLDRYLPGAKAGEGEKAKPGEKKKAESKPAKAGKSSSPDYTALRKMVVDGQVKVGRLKASNITIQDFTAHVTGKNGVFNLDPLSLNLYQGSVAAKAGLDVRKNRPATRLSLDAKGIQAGPLIKDGASMEVIEGTLAAGMNLAMTGDTPEMVKKSLTGKGEVSFTDGAVIGVDLANMVRNVGSKLGVSQTPDQKPRTDFSELKIPFSAGNGLANVQDASLVSPLLRVLVKGSAHLIKETLDFRVDPKFVATLKGQGDTKERSGLMVPVLVTGTFAEPKIRPDLKGMLGKDITDPKKLQQLIQGDGSGQDGKSIEEEAKGLLKGLLGN
ncbi:AsmA family protein [Desulfospira joergensenii]|uniref:AsmA family protein n=1 Tax=Desulfospira joergensenii TaxID=53329 RepID=UPI0003B5CD35|nr:AsmA family protein [Desulfospira joergensenii]